MLSSRFLHLRVLAVVSIAAGAVSAHSSVPPAPTNSATSQPMAAAAVGAQTSGPVTNQLAEDERVKLSVFEVTTSKDIGYQSTNAAEVTRMNTAITDIPMNVTVLRETDIT